MYLWNDSRRRWDMGTGMKAQDILNTALLIPKAQFEQVETYIARDFCGDEVSSSGLDAVYYCDEHGCVEAYWHESAEE